MNQNFFLLFVHFCSSDLFYLFNYNNINNKNYNNSLFYNIFNSTIIVFAHIIVIIIIVVSTTIVIYITLISLLLLLLLELEINKFKKFFEAYI